MFKSIYWRTVSYTHLVAFALTFQSLTRTLNDEEVDGQVQKILDRLTRDVGAVLRS